MRSKYDIDTFMINDYSVSPMYNRKMEVEKDERVTDEFKDSYNHQMESQYDNKYRVYTEGIPAVNNKPNNWSLYNNINTL